MNAYMAIERRELLSDILYAVRDAADLVAMTGLSPIRAGEIMEMRKTTIFDQEDLDQALIEVVEGATDEELASIAKLESETISEARAAVLALKS